jgi:type IV secretory pathway VirB6-like protein
MDLGSKYSEIKDFLLISDKEFRLREIFDHYIETNDLKIEILAKIKEFIYNFSMFRTITPLMNFVYHCIEVSLDFKFESINDFKELLIKNTLMRFLQDYINYSQLTQKKQILKVLSDSLEKLQIQPLIINLGLLLKPMYQDQKYLENLSKYKEEYVTYTLNENLELNIKNAIDIWLNSQTITLENQSEIKNALQRKFDTLIEQYNISALSEKYKNLFTEIMEMLSMKLIMISLAESITDKSLEPIPIR